MIISVVMTLSLLAAVVVVIVAYLFAFREIEKQRSWVLQLSVSHFADVSSGFGCFLVTALSSFSLLEGKYFNFWV